MKKSKIRREIEEGLRSLDGLIKKTKKRYKGKFCPMRGVVYPEMAQKRIDTSLEIARDKLVVALLRLAEYEEPGMVRRGYFYGASSGRPWRWMKRNLWDR